MKKLVVIIFSFFSLAFIIKKDRGHFVELYGKKQYVITAGKGSPAVIFVTGKGRDHSDFDSVFKEISKITKVFAYDRAGLGKSEFIENQRRVDTMAIELNFLLEKERIKPPYLLVGQSLGGYVIRCFANMYPNKVKGLLMVDPANEEDFLRMKNARTPVDKLKWNEEYQGYLNRPDRTKGHNEESRYVFDTTGYSIDALIVKSFSLPKTIPITVITSILPFTPPPYDKIDTEIKFQVRDEWKKQAPQLKHITTVNSGHYINISEPQLIISEINSLIKDIKANNNNTNK